MNREEIKHTIENFYFQSTFEEEPFQSSRLSLESGIAGELLMNYELWKEYDESRYKDRTFVLLDILIQQMHRCTEFSLANGFAGIMFLLQHLCRENIIEPDMEFFDEFDPYFETFTENMYGQGIYDVLYGMMGPGVYYLEKNSWDSRCAPRLYEIIQKLFNLSLSENGMFYWIYKNIESAPQEYGRVVSLGLLHGMPSIIAFLLSCIKEGHGDEKMERVVKGGLKFLCDSMVEEDDYSMPYFISLDQKMASRKSRLGYCYGDLGISHLFFQAGDILSDIQYQQISQEILKKILIRISRLEGVSDAYFCHGISGILYLIDRAESHFPDGDLTKLKVPLFAKLQGCIDEKKQIENGLLNGNSGIILSLLCLEKTQQSTLFERYLLLN